jgi:hypothetical protein
VQRQGEGACTIQGARARSFDGQILPSTNDRAVSTVDRQRGANGFFFSSLYFLSLLLGKIQKFHFIYFLYSLVIVFFIAIYLLSFVYFSFL